MNREKTGVVNKLTKFVLDINWVKDKIFGKARQQVMKLSGGLYPAPLKILDVIRVRLFKFFPFQAISLPFCRPESIKDSKLDWRQREMDLASSLKHHNRKV